MTGEAQRHLGTLDGTLAIVGASYLQLPLVLKARELGLRTVCFAWADGAVCREACDEFVELSITEKERIAEACAARNVRGIVTIASDVAVPTVCHVAAKLGLPGNSERSGFLSTNKGAMREAFAAAGVKVPPFAKVRDEAAGEAAADGIDDGTEYAAGASASASNVWWEVTTSSNLFYQEYIDNRPSWPDVATSYGNWTWTFSTERPWSNAVVRDVTITGFVDDVIKIDGHEIDWRSGPKSFDHFSITNQIDDLQSGHFDVSLLDWPGPHFSGPNEVKIGWTNTEPFVVEWTWWVPFDVRMEPVFTSTTDYPQDNPSGIVLGSNGWFIVEPTPYGLIPQTNFVWTTTLNMLSLLSTNRSLCVKVGGVALGEGEVRVDVEGAHGELNLPPFHVKVVPLTLVTAKVGIVVSTNQLPAANTNTIRNMFRIANDLLIQLGLQIVPIEPFSYIPDEGGFFDMIQKSTAEQTLKA